MIDTPEHHLCTRCSCEIPTIVYVKGDACPYCSTCAIITLFHKCQHPDPQRFAYRGEKHSSWPEDDPRPVPTTEDLDAQFALI